MSNSFEHFDDLPAAPADALTPRRRWGLAIAGAVVGAVVGPSGFLLQLRLSTYRSTGEDLLGFPGSPSQWAGKLRSIGSMGGGRAFLACAFIATLLLAPILIRWLERRLDRSRRAYYLGAATGGVVFGAAATFFVAWGLAIIALFAGLASGSAETNAGMSVAAAIAGVLIFGPLVGLFAPFFFLLPIVGAGVPFGVGYGLAVRRLARKPDRGP